MWYIRSSKRTSLQELYKLKGTTMSKEMRAIFDSERTEGKAKENNKEE